MKIPEKWKPILKSLGLMVFGACIALAVYWGRDIYYDHKFTHALRTKDAKTLIEMGFAPKPPAKTAEAGR